MPDYLGLKAAAAARQAANPGWGDVQILSDINAATVQQPNLDTPIAAIFDALLSAGLWGGIVRAAGAASTTASAVGDVCLMLKALVDAMNGQGLSVVQTSDATKAAAFDAGVSALVAAGLVTTTVQQAIAALRTPSTVTLRAQLGWPGGVNEEDLIAARNV